MTNRPRTSEAHKTIAKTAESAFGSQMKDVVRHLGPQQQSHVDIMRCPDCPQRGVTSFATIGLSDTPLYLRGEEFHARIELVGACASASSEFVDILASAAFMVINSRYFCAPGVIFRDVVGAYVRGMPMQHLAFTSPFLWGDEAPPTIEVDGRTVAWLFGIPVSDDEAKYADVHGFDALERVFEEKQIDVFDLARASVV